MLNGSRRVHPLTGARVQRAVEALAYRPNILARSLRRQRTGTIGLLVSNIELPYFTEIARSVETTAHERGYSVVLCNTDEDAAKEALYIDNLLGKRVDGLLIAPVPGDHRYLRAHLAAGVRCVFVNRYVEGLGVPAVVCDDFAAMRALTARLISDGHRRLGAVTGLSGISTTERRLAGFRAAMVEAGLNPDHAWIHSGDAGVSGGVAAARALAVAMDGRPTTVVAFNSSMMDGVLVGLAEEAPHLLDSIHVTGYGCSTAARLAPACRYALEPPTREMGRLAVTLLIDSLRDDRVLDPSIVRLEAPLVDVEVGRNKRRR